MIEGTRLQVSAAAAAVTLALLAAACSTATDSSTSAATDSSTSSLSDALGNFPEFPPGRLPEATEAALQAVLDTAVKQSTFRGVAASVIGADRGNWSSAAGSWDGVPVTPDARHPTHSAGKTIVAAEVLRLAEDGSLALDDLASSHLPPDMGFFDANGATIRQVLGMRSGIPDLNEDAGFYPAEQAATAVEVFRKLPEPEVPPGTVTHYASTNYVLLGTIIEHATGRPMSEMLRSDVLDRPGLEGLVYTVEDALAADGWGVETTSASLARWGWDLYGGSVLSTASLREMTDFEGEWYGLGVMDFSSEFGTAAIGHQGLSSTKTCCSAILLLALPEEGMVISVQANTTGTPASVDTNAQVNQLAQSLRLAAQE